MCFSYLPEVSFLFQMWHPQINTQRLIVVLGKGADLLEICLKFGGGIMLFSFVAADLLVVDKLKVVEERL